MHVRPLSMMGPCLGLASLLVAQNARAEDVFWLGANSRNWSDPANWVFNNGPDNNGLDGVALYGLNLYTQSTVDQNYHIKGITFSNGGPDVPSTYTVDAANGALLSVNAYLVNYANAEQIITAPIRLMGMVGVYNNYAASIGKRFHLDGGIDLNNNALVLFPSANGISIGAPIFGAGGIQIDADGPVYFEAANTFIGALRIEKGTAIYSADAHLASATRIEFSQDTPNVFPTLRRTTSGTVAVPLVMNAGEGRLDAPEGVVITLSKGLEGSTDFAKTGTGTVVLAARSNHNGDIYIREGTLQATATSALSGHKITVAAETTLALAANRGNIAGQLEGAGSIQLGSASLLQVGQISGGARRDGSGLFSGVISGGSGTLAKRSTGTLSLTGASTYAGATNVVEGVLSADNLVPGTSATGASTVTVSAGATLAGDGAVSGSVTILQAGRIAPSSVATPGSGIGSLSTGPLTLQAGAIATLELTQTAADAIAVTGNLTLAGRLDLVPSAPIPLGATHTILSWTGARTGAFATVNGVTRPDGTRLAVTYAANAAHLTAAVAGDATLSDGVTFDDLLLLAQHYGQASGQGWAQGDFDGNGGVDFDDLLALSQHYNHPANFERDWALAQSLAPEPATLLAAASFLSVAGRRRRPVI